MKIRLVFLLIILMTSHSAVCGEITDKSLASIAGRTFLEVTYHTGSYEHLKVVCTAYNKDKKAIGAGKQYTDTGVATVTIELPRRYRGEELDVTCDSLETLLSGFDL